MHSGRCPPHLHTIWTTEQQQEQQQRHYRSEDANDGYNRDPCTRDDVLLTSTQSGPRNNNRNNNKGTIEARMRMMVTIGTHALGTMSSSPPHNLDHGTTTGTTTKALSKRGCE